jgi:hypothetical protein
MSDSIDEIMGKHGFAAGSSGGGCEWYTKTIEHQGKGVFIAITDDGGLGLPESLDDPVIVGIYDLDSGDLIEEAKSYESLKSYIEEMR